MLALSPVSIIYGQGFMIEPSLVCFTLATLCCWTIWLEEARWLALSAATASLTLLLLTKLYMLVLLLPLATMAARQASGGRKPPDDAASTSPGRASGTPAAPPSLLGGPHDSAQPEAARLIRPHRACSVERVIEPNVGGFQSCAPPSKLGGGEGCPAFVSSAESHSPPSKLGGVYLFASAVALLAATIPAAAWLAHAWRLSDPTGPQAAAVYYSLRHSADAHGFPHPLLGTGGFYLQALRNLGGVALTPIGLTLAALGLLHAGARRHGPWLLSMAALVVVMPRKFHEMNYYYLVILPPLCVLAGLGWQVASDRLKPAALGVAVLLIASAGLSLRLAWKAAFVTPQEDRSVVAAAAAVRELTTPDEPVATLHGTTLDLLYYCDRPGWALSCEKNDMAERLAECRRQGARYLAVAGAGRLDGAARRAVAALAIVHRGDDYLIARLP